MCKCLEETAEMAASENYNVIRECIRSLNSAIQLMEASEDGREQASIRIENVVTLLGSIDYPQFPTVAGLLRNALLKLEDGGRVEVKGRGRPEISIPEESLEYFLSLDFKVPEMAKLFHVSVRTIYNRMSGFDLSVKGTYSAISDGYLDHVVQEILLGHPNTGYKRMRGFLRARDIKVTVIRVRESIARLDPVGVEIRRRQNRAIHRREYFVNYSMEIWHIDTHHKLIRWGIVVRGGIDGKSRAIVYLDAGRDNTAASNLESFMGGVAKYGVPMRTRSDKGGENVRVAEFMLHNRGTGRGSHICGRSVHNQRIERLWRDVFYGCLSMYKDVFLWLEEHGHVEVDNPRHIGILQLVFVPRIQMHLQEFMNAWNLHPLSSEHNKTPMQLMLMNLPPAEYDMRSTSNMISAEEDLQIHSSTDVAALLSSSNIIVIEDYQSFLSTDEVSRLNDVDFLRESTCMGVDIFLEILNLLQN